MSKKKINSKKKSLNKKRIPKKESHKIKNIKKEIVKPEKNYPTLYLKTEHEIALDFATKVYQKFNKIIKSVILFGSVMKQSNVAGSDIDIIIVIDDTTIKWDQELIAWYREELDKLLKQNPYNEDLHINTIKISTWWEDLIRGDPTILNILRYGEAMIDFAGFFDPIKSLLIQGKIKSTPEAIYSSLQRAPMHLARSKAAVLNSIEGLYWSMVDSAQAALIAAGDQPPSPEHITSALRENFVNTKNLKVDYVRWYKEILSLHKNIAHGEIRELKGIEIDKLQDKAEKFLQEMARIVNSIVGKE